MKRFLAPSGSPVRAAELLACLAGGDRSAATLASELAGVTGHRQGILLRNGRGAMTLLLRALADRASDNVRRTVVVPSYTCYSVAASVLKSGLELQICDIDPNSLTYSPDLLDKIDFSRVLAIVSANLYGVPDRLERLEVLAKQNGCHLVDDAAQALGATLAGRPVGGFGTAGICSLDKGKVITSINGGAIVTSDSELADMLAERAVRLPRPGIVERLVESVKLGVYALFLHPRLYSVPASLPFLGLGETRYVEDEALQRYFARLAPLARRQLARLPAINARRRQVADWYRQRLPDHPSLEHIDVSADALPVYLRFPLRIGNTAARETFLATAARLGVTRSYPRALPDVTEIGGRYRLVESAADGGRQVARELVTLPTHAYVTERDVSELSGLLQDCLASAGRPAA